MLLRICFLIESTFYAEIEWSDMGVFGVTLIVFVYGLLRCLSTLFSK